MNVLGDLCNYFNDTVRVTNGCVKKNSDRRTWYDARDQCLSAGGDLAVLDYADLDVLTDRGQIYILRWIGLRKTSWRWNLNGRG